ncbi:helix-turn-helix domain-containing protein [Streptomyces sp. LP05-1]|uniref:Helix-turn-helix domain-containing protein n=1 Tax=Streptomyces pyxinae TaxID=2970734 RepID=A0ABT2CK51_9ACTN|nr:helix-turn-helix domain-containing protein [Streptomyces sp. LP05-1]MCS0637680.1 helix-turn-helix domain-containing protein [Streptomyces sp. LP05-1]
MGGVLKQARIDAGLSVEEISASTRVRIPIVRGLEEDDFSRCGGDVYARGHIRTLARAVGIDPAPLVERYDADHGGAPAPTPAAPLFEAERIRPERRRPNWTAAMVAAIVAVIGFVGFTLMNGDEAESRATQVAEGPTAGHRPSTSPKPHRPTAPAPTESAVAAVPKDKVTVKLTAVDDKSWISVKAADGRLLFDGLLEKGESKTYQDAERLDLILGNAGAIELFVNGKKVEDQFETGQVERLSYGKGDPQAG